MMMMIMVVSASAASGFVLLDPLGLFNFSSSTNGVGGDGGDSEGDIKDDCIAYKDEKCAGKSGRERETCVKKAKEECIADGGYWNKEKHEENSKTVAEDAESGESLKLPEQMRNDTDENCVYFYDLESPEKWSADHAPKVKARGYWCLSDNKNAYGDKNAIETEGLKGTWLKKNTVDHAKIGRNVRVMIWPHDSDGGKQGEAVPVWGRDTAFTIEGKEYGTGKIYSFKNSPIGYDDMDAFQLAKSGEDFIRP